MAETTPTRRDRDGLTRIGAEIQREHDAAQQAFRSAVEHAIRCGELLIEAKTQLPSSRRGRFFARKNPGKPPNTRPISRSSPVRSRRRTGLPRSISSSRWIKLIDRSDERVLFGRWLHVELDALPPDVLRELYQGAISYAKRLVHWRTNQSGSGHPPFGGPDENEARYERAGSIYEAAIEREASERATIERFRDEFEAAA